MQNKKNQETIDSFPRVRKPLPEEFQKVYATHYKSNRQGKTSAASMSQKMESWMHKKVAADLSKDDLQIKTLEIGAGTLNQLKYEPQTTYDIIEPFTELFSDSNQLNRINTIYSDIREIENRNYDRITSIATFEHINDLPFVVAKTCLLLNDGGALRAAIPNEGTILWKLGWMFTTGLEFKLKYNLKYSTLLYHEHVNNAADIESVLNFFYFDIKCHVFGVHKKLGLYRYYECKKPKVEVAQNYLSNYIN
ncbi:MAG: hypothetical protein WCX31_21320 [Salinivirgaceae bacterium]|jgi:hypothetical protein